MLSYLSVFLIPFLLIAEESPQSLLIQYKNYYPFHQNLETPMPDEVCNEQGCSREIQIQDNIQKFDSLLAKTEKLHNIEDAQFTASPLGKYYRMLKSFVTIQEELKICQAQAPIFTKTNLSHFLQRLSSNVSVGELDNSCQIQYDNQILSDGQFGFFSEMTEFQLNSELILDSLQRSLEARITFEKKFNKKDIVEDSFASQLMENICQNTVMQNVRTQRGFRQRPAKVDTCTGEDKNLLTTIIREKITSILQFQKEDFTMSTEQVRRDINSRIAEVNSVLERHNREQENFKRQWDQEDAEDLRTYGNREYLYQIRPQRRRARRQEYTRLKQTAFDEYLALYAGLHESGAGNLLQTHAIKDAAGINELEEIKAKWFGLGGFEPASLQEEDASFPLLKPINYDIAQSAVQESLIRTKSQVIDLLERRRNPNKTNQTEALSYLITVNPLSAGHILLNNPQYAGLFCKAAQSIAADKRNQVVIDTGVFLVLGIGVAVASLTTLGGSLPLTATVAGLAAGGALTIGEYLYQSHQADKNRERQMAILNAYLAGAGDDQTIDQIRESWQVMIESEYYANMSLVFGLFDVMGVIPAAQAGAFIRLIATVDGLDTGPSSTNKLIYLISKNGTFIKTVRRLMDQYPKGKAGALLNFIAKLPKRKQRAILNELSRAPTLDNLTFLGQAHRVKSLLTADELNSLAQIITERRSISSAKRIELLVDESYGNYFSQLSSREQQDMLAEAIVTMEAKGKNRNHIMQRLREAFGECGL